MKKIIAILSLILLFGCAATTQYVQRTDTNNDLNSNTKEYLAQIYVLRPSAYGSAITYKIYQGEKFIGELGPRSYLTWQVDPAEGPIDVISKMENYAILPITPEAGKTYYIKQKVKMGWVMARTELELLTEEKALEILKKLKPPKTQYLIP